MTDHRELRERLGGYALGALEPQERAELELHLADCAPCREELVRLAVLPGLLAHLDHATAHGPLPEPPPDLVGRALTAVGTRRRQVRRARLVRWGAGLAGCATVAVVVVGIVAARSDEGNGAWTALRVEPVAAEARTVEGTAEATGEAWGTAVVLDLRALPPRSGYVLVAVGEGGRRETAATWAATPSGAAKVWGSCSIRPQDMSSYEVTARDGEVLLRLDA